MAAAEKTRMASAIGSKPTVAPKLATASSDAPAVMMHTKTQPTAGGVDITLFLRSTSAKPSRMTSIATAPAALAPGMPIVLVDISSSSGRMIRTADRNSAGRRKPRATSATAPTAPSATKT